MQKEIKQKEFTNNKNKFNKYLNFYSLLPILVVNIYVCKVYVKFITVYILLLTLTTQMF